MNEHPWPQEKRRHPRIFLGLPVRVYLSGEDTAATLELCNISIGGGYFRISGRQPLVNQWVVCGFVTADRSLCAARGRVVRIDNSGFALKLESANSAFKTFVEDISRPFMCAA